MKKIARLLLHDLPLHIVLILTNWLPDNTPFLRLRGTLARPFFNSCGRNLRLGRNVTFYNPSQIQLGNDIYIAQGGWFMAGGRIEIDSEVMFGPYCVIVSSDHTRQNRSFRFGPPSLAPVRIGAGSWLAAHVTVTAGSSIGSGTLVAANSVVRGHIPCGVIAAGAPARIRKPMG